MNRLTGLDAYGDIISTEEYDIIATRTMTDKEEETIKNHLLERLYELENKEDELKRLTNLFEKTFKQGCDDTTKALYMNAVYAVISESSNCGKRIEEFEKYVQTENIKEEENDCYEK